MGDLQRKTDPALRVVRAVARLICAVIYLRLTKSQSLSVTVFELAGAAFSVGEKRRPHAAFDEAFKPSLRDCCAGFNLVPVRRLKLTCGSRWIFPLALADIRRLAPNRC
jgi:hypothetical protein